MDRSTQDATPTPAFSSLKKICDVNSQITAREKYLVWCHQELRRMYRELGPGDSAELRLAFFQRLWRLVQKYDHRVMREVLDRWRYSRATAAPDRTFTTSIRRRLHDLGWWE
jgi:hypothetical protein